MVATLTRGRRSAAKPEKSGWASAWRAGEWELLLFIGCCERAL